MFKTYRDIAAIPIILNQIADQYNKQVLVLFHNLARERIAQQVAKGNNQFSISVDGRASNLAGISAAHKVIHVQFTAEALRLALEIVRAHLRRAIASSTITRSGHLREDLMVMYAPPGRPFTQVATADEVEFAVGGIVCVFPTAKYSGVVNHYVTQGSARAKARERGRRNANRAAKGQGAIKSKLPRGQGFMGEAAANIRKAIGNLPRQKNQSVAVKAIFSTAIPAQAGLKVSGKLLGKGWPVIMIELRGTQTASLVGA